MYFATLFRFVLLMALLLPGPQWARAEATVPVVVDAKTEVILLDKVYFDVLEDPTGRLTLAQVQQPAAAARFGTLPGQPYTMRQPGAAYWMRFRVRNDGPSASQWFLELFDSHLARVTWYQPRGPGLPPDSVVTGAGRPYLSRFYQYRDFIFPLQLAARSEQVYYVRLSSPTKTSLRSIVWNQQNLVIHLRNDSIWLGSFYGILGIIVLYNLCLFFFVRERTYLYYILYVLSCGLFFLSEDGLGFEYLWPDHPALNLFISDFAPVLLLFLFALYSHYFLDTGPRLPRYNPWLKRITVFSVVLILLDIVVLRSGRGYWLYVLPYAAYYAAGVLLLRQGSKPARFYLVANLVVAISVVFLIARKLGIELLSDQPITVYSMNIALVLEVFVLSYALGEKIQDIRNDALRTQQQLLKQLRKKHRVQEQLVEQLRHNQDLKDNLNAELERQVLVRTEELRHHAQTIVGQNAELSDAVALLNQQAATIEQLNHELKRDLQQTQEARVLSKAVSFEEFGTTYPDRDACLRYLAEIKWTAGFRCRKCGHEKSCEAREPFAQRCTRCGYVESATAYTPLHRCKFDIVKALYCIFVVHTQQGNYSSLVLSQTLQLRRATCSSFLQKVHAAVLARQQAPGYVKNESWTNVLFEEYQPLAPADAHATWASVEDGE
ncbi:MAG: transposase [Bacteroidota bacterium]|nr:transposase [Bacteroidota bacterium]